MTKFLFVTDLDHTFVGDDQALLQLSDRLSFTANFNLILSSYLLTISSLIFK